MPRVVLIDDNPQDRRLARRALEQEFTGIEIVEVSDEAGLMSALESTGADAVVTDFRLRSTDGLRVLAHVKQRLPDMPVVMFTGSGNEEIAAQGFRQGLSDYILKGVGQYARLAHGVRRAIDRARAERSERELLAREQEARRLAEEANQVKDLFLATLSHELRTPLNAIAGWVHLVRVRVASPDQVLRYADRAERNIQLLGRIIDDLTDTSRIAAGKLSIHPQRVALDPVVRAAIHSVEDAAAAKSVGIHLSLRGASSAQVIGDVDRLQQIVVNLLSNAVKFTPHGGRVDVAIEGDDQFATVTVRDTGQGIKPEFVDRVFDRFSQQDTGPSRAHDGLGLGLALVRDLVQLHGGTVAVESSGENQGATFVVKLPAATDEAVARG